MYILKIERGLRFSLSPDERGWRMDKTRGAAGDESRQHKRKVPKLKF